MQLVLAIVQDADAEPLMAHLVGRRPPRDPDGGDRRIPAPGQPRGRWLACKEDAIDERPGHHPRPLPDAPVPDQAHRGAHPVRHRRLPANQVTVGGATVFVLNRRSDGAGLMSARSGRRRVAILHYAAPPLIGGVEATMADHARLLAARGYAVRLVAGRGRPGARRLRAETRAPGRVPASPRGGRRRPSWPAER